MGSWCSGLEPRQPLDPSAPDLCNSGWNSLLLSATYFIQITLSSSVLVSQGAPWNFTTWGWGPQRSLVTAFHLQPGQEVCL